jgi:hypothetical protein
MSSSGSSVIDMSTRRTSSSLKSAVCRTNRWLTSIRTEQPRDRLQLNAARYGRGSVPFSARCMGSSAESERMARLRCHGPGPNRLWQQAVSRPRRSSVQSTTLPQSCRVRRVSHSAFDYGRLLAADGIRNTNPIRLPTIANPCGKLPDFHSRSTAAYALHVDIDRGDVADDDDDDDDSRCQCGWPFMRSSRPIHATALYSGIRSTSSATGTLN